MKSAIAALLAPALLVAAPVRAAVVFSDSFSTYTSITGGSDPLIPTWTPLSGGTSTNLTTNSLKPIATKFGTTYLQIERNTVFQHDVADFTGDFTLSASVGVDAFSTGKQLWFGVFDAAGTHGYVAHFNSQISGGGVVRLKEFSVAAPSNLTYNLAGTNLTTSAATSGLSDASTEAAHITLQWEASISRLTLYVNNVEKLSATLTAPITSFSYLSLGGTTGTQFTDIQLSTSSIPEPASAASFAAGAGFLLATSRRRRRPV